MHAKQELSLPMELPLSLWLFPQHRCVTVVCPLNLESVETRIPLSPECLRFPAHIRLRLNADWTTSLTQQTDIRQQRNLLFLPKTGGK